MLLLPVGCLIWDDKLLLSKVNQSAGLCSVQNLINTKLGKNFFRGGVLARLAQRIKARRWAGVCWQEPVGRANGTKDALYSPIKERYL